MAPEHVSIVEVGPRDGLQAEPDFFPSFEKVRLIELLVASGLRRIEVTSFVHPKVMPQFVDAAEVLKAIPKVQGVTFSALVPNMKGCARALETDVHELALFLSASETHNRKNVGMSVSESLVALREVARAGLSAGRRLRGYVATAFGCPYEGRVHKERVYGLVSAYFEMGVSEVSLGDTTGMANPDSVRRLMGKLIAEVGDPKRIGAHFHNTRGLAIANALAAYDSGVRVFDASIGGIGGCPTAKEAAGNATTEDLVNMFEEMGVSTGVDFEKLRDASAHAQKVIGRALPSFTLVAGRPRWEGGVDDNHPCAQDVSKNCAA